MLRVSTEAELLREVTNHNQIFVLCYASWCPFCQRFLPIFKTVMEEDKTGALLVNLENTSNPLWIIYNIEVVPTVFFFEEGKMTQRLDGVFGIGVTEKRFTLFLRSVHG